VELADGEVIADFESTSPLGNETIVIPAAQLRTGTYYIAVSLYTRNAVARGSVTATLFRGIGGSAPETVKLELDQEPLPAKRFLKKIEVVQ
jgi:hypothetical protein